jgi:YVTN family beta-propeller protein
MIMFKKLLLVSLISISLFSCKKKEEQNDDLNNTPNVEDTGYLHGKFIVNEGNFMSNNGSISYIGASGIVNEVYQMVNGLELGDVLQSFTVIGERGYAVLNNSQKIVVVDLKTMSHVATISGLDYPRYVIDGGNGLAYVSNGSGDGSVFIIDLSSNTIQGNITVGKGPEKMWLDGDHLFVCNSGGWELDNSISVIDVNTNTVVSTIVVGDRPMDLTQDLTGDIWVMCSGNDSWMTGGETMASLYRINIDALAVETFTVIGTSGIHPKHIASNAAGSVIYYEQDGVKSITLSSDEPTESVFLSEGIGSIDVDPSNGDVWTTSVSDYVNPSSVTCRGADGTLKASYTAGLISTAVVFN